MASKQLQDLREALEHARWWIASQPLAPACEGQRQRLVKQIDAALAADHGYVPSADEDDE